MSKTIPEIRDRLLAMARELTALAEATRRRRFGQVAPIKSRVIDRHMCAAVRAYKKHNPKIHQRTIGAHFGIDGGRVNEILRGMRDGRSYEEAHNL